MGEQRQGFTGNRGANSNRAMLGEYPGMPAAHKSVE
jgi:hypothetical protein